MGYYPVPGRQYKIEREQDARAVAKAIEGLYTRYRCEPVKPKGCRLYRIAIFCKATGARVGTAEQ